jgi:CheY-like chemotaxis protein
LNNLIGNAIKFTDQGKIEIAYQVKKTFIEFSVTDSGIGICKENRENIFQRFYRERSSKNQLIEGTGLGLSIAKAFTDILDGKIWVTSKLGIGSTFYFSIPLKKGDPQPSEIKGKAGIKLTPSDQKKLRILIAEDDMPSRIFLERAMAPFSLETFSEEHGNSVIRICKEHPEIDLLLLDIRLPDVDGYEIAQQIRKFNDKIIIIAQTACNLMGDKEMAIACGCNEFISKPMRKNDLLTLVKKYFPIGDFPGSGV